MAGASLLTLLDDIATILDDVAVMTKTASAKTVGVVGDDLALGAQQVAGVRAEREIPVVLAVARGSAINKLILVPVALTLSALAPWTITPLLMAGGTYLCLEGFEKIAHKWLHSKAEDEKAHANELAAVIDTTIDLEKFEAEKIRGAIKTDIILSGEILVITLGTVATQSLAVQATVLSIMAVVMTVGVYGLVMAIVRMDDMGFALIKRTNAISRFTGRALLSIAPKMMRVLTFVGTAAMFLVGGEILVHGIGPAHHALEAMAAAAGPFGAPLTVLGNFIFGIAAGAVAVGAMTLFNKVRGKQPTLIAQH